MTAHESQEAGASDAGTLSAENQSRLPEQTTPWPQYGVLDSKTAAFPTYWDIRGKIHAAEASGNPGANEDAHGPRPYQNPYVRTETSESRLGGSESGTQRETDAYRSGSNENSNWQNVSDRRPRGYERADFTSSTNGIDDRNGATSQRRLRWRRSMRRLIFGAVVAFLIAPIVFVGVLLTAGQIGQRAADMQQIANNSAVTITETESYFVIAANGTVSSCALIDDVGQEHQMTTQAAAQGFYQGNLTPGTYQLVCEGSGDFSLMGAPFIAEAELYDISVKSVGWSSLVGFTGLGIAAWGLAGVLRNRN